MWEVTYHFRQFTYMVREPVENPIRGSSRRRRNMFSRPGRSDGCCLWYILKLLVNGSSKARWTSSSDHSAINAFTSAFSQFAERGTRLPFPVLSFPVAVPAIDENAIWCQEQTWGRQFLQKLWRTVQRLSTVFLREMLKITMCIHPWRFTTVHVMDMCHVKRCCIHGRYKTPACEWMHAWPCTVAATMRVYWHKSAPAKRRCVTRGHRAG